MQRALIAIFALVVVVGAVLAFVLFAGAGSKDGAVGPRARRDDVARPQGPASLERDGPSAAKEASTAHAGRIAANAPKEDGVRLGTLLPQDDAVLVRVLVKETKLPVAGAEVAVVDYADFTGPAGVLATADGWSYENAFRILGRRYVADRDGVARVPRPRQHIVAAASFQDLWGKVEFTEEGQESVELLLEHDSTVRVRVVDEHGVAVAGAPVALRIVYPQWRHDIAPVRSGPDGIAKLEHLRAYVQQSDEIKPFAALAILAHDPVEKELDLSDLPEDPLELVMPATGSLEILLVRSDAEPVTEPCVVTLQMNDVPTDGRTIFPGAGRQMQRGTQDGRVLIDHIGLGLTLVASFWSPRYSCEPVGISAPSLLGERVQAKLVARVETPVVVGRALDESGMPLADVTLAASITTWTGESSNGWGTGLRTDAEGRFVVPVSSSNQNAERMELHLSTSSPTPPRLTAMIALPPRMMPGELDVGDVEMALPALVAAGIVADEGGTPVRGAGILPTSSVGFDENGVESWQDHWDLRAISDRAGRFEIRGELQGSTIRLSATHPRFAPSKQVLASIGSDGVLLTLAGAGALAGRVLTDEGVSRQTLQIVAQRTGTPDQINLWGTQEDGSFEFKGLVAGTYTISLSLWEEGLSVAELSDVRIVAGETTRDTRMDPLDLRGKLRTFKLRAKDGSGAPVNELGIARRVPGEESYRDSNRTSSIDGTYTLTTAAAVLDLRVQSRTRRSVELLGVRGDQEVVLGPGIPIALVLRGDARVQSEEYKVMVTLQRNDAQSNWTEQAAFDATRTARFDVGDPGTYHVYFLINVFRGEEYVWSGYLEDEQGREIQVLDSVALQTIELELSTAAIDAVLAQARAQIEGGE